MNSLPPRLPRKPRWLNGWQALVALAYIGPAPSLPSAPKPSVGIEISVPARKTHVIGDAIELNWRFSNQSSNQLAFMWEGCCRVNGRVEMKRKGPPVAPKQGIRPRHTGFGPGIYNPSCLHCRIEKQKQALDVAPAPMGPATAHMFAKPVRLRPGGTEDITSRLANWVLLEQSGDYVLTGNYLGVHPKQRPQMPRGADLWTEVATSPPIELTLLSPEDYLAERDARSLVRGIRLELNRQLELQPFSDLGLSVSLTNLTASNITLHWPGEAAFWLLDEKGVRVPDSRYVITKYGDAVTLPAGGSVTVPLAVNADILAGKPFGRYQAFVELKETADHLRAPSNPVTIEWQLDTSAVRELLLGAGDKPAIGHRNPPLKLLRQHLPDLRVTLAQLDTSGLGERSRELAEELREAAQLSRLHPQPGSVSVHVAIDPHGQARFQDPGVANAFGDRYAAPSARLARILTLRRHLGWTVSLSLRVSPEARLGAVRALLLELQKELPGLAGKPHTKAFNRTATAFSEITFAAPDAPFTPSDILLSDQTTGTLRSHQGFVRLVAPSSLTWSEVLRLASPLVDQGRAFELLIQP